MEGKLIPDERTVATIVRGDEFRGMLPKDYIARPDELVVIVENGVISDVVTQDRIKGVGGGLSGFLSRKFQIGKDVELLIVNMTEKQIDLEVMEQTKDYDTVKITGPLAFNIDHDNVTSLYGFTRRQPGMTLKVDTVHDRIESELPKVFTSRVRQIPSEDIHSRAVIDDLTSTAHVELRKTMTSWGLRFSGYTPTFSMTALEAVKKEAREDELKVMSTVGKLETKTEISAEERGSHMVERQGAHDETMQDISLDGTERTEKQRAQQDLIGMEKGFDREQTLEDVKAKAEQDELKRETDEKVLRMLIKLREEADRVEVEYERQMMELRIQWFQETELKMKELDHELRSLAVTMDTEKARYSNEQMEKTLKMVDDIRRENTELMVRLVEATSTGAPVARPTGEGQSPSGDRRCVGCGMMVRSSAKFCDNCGAKLA
jgi:hypothetical protein